MRLTFASLLLWGSGLAIGWGLRGGRIALTVAGLIALVVATVLEAYEVQHHHHHDEGRRDAGEH